MSNYLYWMGWNEILARIFSGFQTQRNTSPNWLINPATRRKLKLDYLYPDIGIAVRFGGMQGKVRKSEWEEMEDASRDEIRKELCRLNGVDLILLTPYDPFPRERLSEINMALGAASRRIAKSGRSRGKAELMAQLARARDALATIRRSVSKLEDLPPFAEAWRDRETRAIASTQAPAQSTNGSARKRAAVRKLKAGQWVEHERFGRGVVNEIKIEPDDVYLTINFITEGRRQFMGSLVADKLTIMRD
ncbi:MAG TPA: hypothetical protein G4N94_13010 [Caldilineae bacterium]|nr:hypothetical protein [Caldilineae bacterium]